MKVNGVITEKDSLRSQYLHIKPNFFFGILGILIVVLGMYFLIVSFSILLFLSGLYLALYFGVYIPYRTRKIYNESSGRKSGIELEIIDSGLTWKTSRGFSETQWSEILKWRKGKSMVLIYLNSAMFLVVPSHFFTSSRDFEDFCNLMKAKLGKST